MKNETTARAALTSAPIVAGESTSPKPEFIRLPRVGSADPITGLRRSTLNELILPSALNGHKPPVRSIVLRKPGRARGIRLIDLRSLLNHINGSPAEGGREA